jgi:hypothetical protein
MDLVAVDRGLARGVQWHEVHPQARVEDLARSVRIDKGVVFCVRGGIASHVHRARHHDHPADPSQGIGIETESERQVRQRAQRDERQALGVGPRQGHECLRRRWRGGRVGHGRPIHRIAEAVAPVLVGRGDHQRPAQRSRGAQSDLGRAGGPPHRDQASGVARRVGERRVARDHRQRQDVELG